MNPQIKTLVYPTLIVLIILVCLTSCQSYKDSICRKCLLKETVKDSIVYVVKESIKEVTIHDTTKIVSYLPNPCTEMCDSLGGIKKGFKETIKNNKGTNTTLFEKDGKLGITDEINSIKTLALVVDTTIKEFHSKVVEVPARCQLEHLTWWDRFWIKVGKYLSLVAGIIGVVFAAKFYFKI